MRGPASNRLCMRFDKPAMALLILAATACGSSEPANMSANEVANSLAGMQIEPGLWELITEVVDVRAPGLPLEVRNRMLGPRNRLRNCITPEQAAQPSANFLAGRRDSNCTYRDFVMREGRLSGTMTCPGITARMEGGYSPTAYETAMEMA